MNNIILGCIIGFIIGTTSYIILRFWILPIHRYQKVKKDIRHFFNQFEILISDDIGGSGVLVEQAAVCRKHAAALTDAYYDDLPQWYRMVLAHKLKEFPVEASRDFLTLSNTRAADHARNRVKKIRQYLRI